MKKNKKKKEKRFTISVVEYGVMNSKFKDFRVARIEVFDRKSKSPYAIYEGFIILPKEIFDKFRDLIDMKEFDLPLKIDLNMFDKKYFPDIYKKYYRD